MLDDLEIAEKHLVLDGKTLVLAKNGEVIASSSRQGIVDLVRFAEALGDELIGASIADKVVGKAVALLVRYAGITAVYAVTMSQSAEATLEGTGIKYSYGKLIPTIMNRTGDDLCPMEKLSLSYDDPTEGFLALKTLVKKMTNTAKD